MTALRALAPCLRLCATAGALAGQSPPIATRRVAQARASRPEQLSDREYQIIRMLAEASKLPPNATERVWRGRSPRWTLGEMIVGLSAWALAAAGLWSLVA